MAVITRNPSKHKTADKTLAYNVRTKPKMVPTLSEIVRSVPDRYNIAQATDYVMSELGAMDNGLAVARPAISEYVRLRRRGDTRATEHTIAHQYTPGDGTTRARNYAQELSLAQMRAYAEERVKIPGITHEVRAGEVTIRQWEKRDGMLASKAQGIADSRAFLRTVIRTLKACHAKTIDDALAAGPNDG